MQGKSRDSVVRFAMALGCAAALLQGARAAPLSIETAFKPPAVRDVALSPDGRHLALIGNARSNVSAVLLTKTDSLESRILEGPTGGSERPIAVNWIGSEIIAFDTWSGWTAIDLSGRPLQRPGATFLRAVEPDAEGHERALMRGRRLETDIHRMDVRTGSLTLMNDGVPGLQFAWAFDRDGVPRVVSTRDDPRWGAQAKVTHWYRASLNDKWQELATFASTDVAWRPLHLLPDGRSLAVVSRQGRDTEAVFRYDLIERRIGELMVGHPREDIGPIKRGDDAESDTYLRAVTHGMKPQHHWFDARWAALQASVNAALPDRINELSGKDPSGRVLVSSYADVDPGRWFILDAKAGSLREVAARRPDIDVAAMRPKQIVSYASLDGMQIPAYLTLPAGRKGPGPAVVLVHGGPVVRDSWTWDAEVQLLAAHGYAVLQPQFRGSRGFGKRFEEAGHHQWGRAMQDDITAGARWLAEQRIADPARIAIYGGSYGGYAALWGLAKTPDLFRCGVAMAAVSDLNLMFKDDSDVNDSASGRLWRRRFVGDPKTDQQKFDEVSPLKQVAAIKAPLLLAHGDRDVRVPIEHAEKMLAALKRHDKAVEWLELRDEGHGIFKPENIQRYYGAVLNFLARHLGGTPPAPPIADWKP